MAAAHLKCHRLYIVSHTIGTDKSTDLFVFPISSWRVGSSLRTQLINDIERDTLAYTPKNIYFALHFMLFFFYFCFVFHFFFFFFGCRCCTYIRHSVSIALSQYSFRFHAASLSLSLSRCHRWRWWWCVCEVSCYNVLLCRRNECLIMTILVYVSMCVCVKRPI